MRTAIRSLVIALVVACTTQAQANFYIVVQTANPQPALTQKQAVDLFMGRNRAFANGDVVQVFDLPRDNPRHAAFYQALTGMSPAQVNSYWSRLMFSGQSLPPKDLADEAAMIEMVRRNPHAMGWLSKEPTDKALRTLLELKEPPH